MENIPQELYTVATLTTFCGSSGAVLILYNTFRKLFSRESIWIAFVISLVVSYVVASATQVFNEPIGYFLAFLNACLLFSSAAGTQEIIADQGGVQTKGFQESTASPRGFWSSWFNGG